ncbi:iron transporter [Sphingomonas sp. 8AM]|uniref:iron transporter n=1 Tax=Sphingomonas sp. 8AM TaxID=2653170 RepID=UPI001F31D524|nr:iron transporter [Sphingomonas sp. 8AM]
MRHIRVVALAMLARCLTAFFGGYALTALVATLVARILPIARVDATVWAMIPGFLFYALVGLWSFHEPRLTRVAGAVWGGAVVAGLAVWLLGVRP